MTPKRWLSRFTSLDQTTIVVDFPTARYEWEVDEPVRSPRARVSGAEYALRLLGDRPVLRDVATHTVRCLFVGDSEAQDTAIDDLRNQLYLGALGWVWTLQYEDGDPVRRRALAEISELPRFRVSYEEIGYLPLVISFNVFSEWFLEDAVEVSQTITGSPTNVSVTNPGSYRATRVKIRIRSNTSSGFNHVKIVNQENGHEFESLRVASSSSDEVLFDSTRPAVLYSNDDGTTYVGDFSNYVRPPQGYYLFALEPGEQTLAVTCSGTPNFALEVSFDAPV